MPQLTPAGPDPEYNVEDALRENLGSDQEMLDAVIKQHVDAALLDYASRERPMIRLDTSEEARRIIDLALKKADDAYVQLHEELQATDQVILDALDRAGRTAGYATSNVLEEVKAILLRRTAGRPRILVTIKLPRGHAGPHDPSSKVVGECPFSGECTDSTGEHHTGLVYSDEEVDKLAANHHITRIEVMP